MPMKMRLFRQKYQTRSIQQLAPLFNSIIQQGIREGVLSSPYPHRSGEIVLTLLQAMSDNLSMQLLHAEQLSASLENLEHTVAVYTNAVERVLGVSTGSLHFIDRAALQEWLYAFKKYSQSDEAQGLSMQIPQRLILN